MFMLLPVAVGCMGRVLLINSLFIHLFIPWGRRILIQPRFLAYSVHLIHLSHSHPPHHTLQPFSSSPPSCCLLVWLLVHLFIQQTSLRPSPAQIICVESGYRLAEVSGAQVMRRNNIGQRWYNGRIISNSLHPSFGFILPYRYFIPFHDSSILFHSMIPNPREPPIANHGLPTSDHLFPPIFPILPIQYNVCRLRGEGRKKVRGAECGGVGVGEYRLALAVGSSNK